MSKKTECVKVAVRCRPLSQNEKNENKSSIVTVNLKNGEVIVRNPKADNSGEPEKQFTFDIALPDQISQEVVYNSTALPIIEQLLEGYNGTIFAYGQTGTGKTFTMEGQRESKEQKGITPRTFEHIFRIIEGTPNIQFLVNISYIELYNEEIRDLLGQDYQQKLDLKEDPDKGIYIKGLSKITMQNEVEMMKKLEQGRGNRHMGETKMNRESSRSHCIFMITVEQYEIYQNGEEHFKVGKLNLVDLAGSERQSKTQATGDRFKEAVNINSSLLTLGNVISSLTDPKCTHIPYRDSKLTRLLQDSLGGNTKTVMIANIGPADYNYDETLSTLRYANRAKNIKNKPKINEDPKDAQIRECQELIKRLRDELSSKMGGQIQIGEDGKIKKVIEVEKIVKIEDGEKLKEYEQKLLSEKSELQQKMQEEIEKIQSDVSKTQNEKDKLIQALEVKEKQAEEAKDETKNMIIKLKDMKNIILQGNKMKENQRIKEKELLKAQIELQERIQSERREAEELAKKDEALLKQKEIYTNLKDEIEKKTKQIKTLFNKIKEAKQQYNEINEQSLRQKELILEENANLVKQLSLTNVIIQNFIPQEEVKKLESKLQYSEENDEWEIKDSGDQAMIVERPNSGFNLIRPTCELSRMAISFGDANPRYRHENILQIDLDLPEPTVEEFDGNQSQKLIETINITLADDQNEQEESDDKMPNVYIENPELLTKENVIKQRQENMQNKLKTQRRQSAKNRPQSGVNKKKIN